MDRRRVLYPILKEQRALGQKVRLVMDKLYINNELFRDPKITKWFHNLFVADALRHRDVGGKAIETLTRLFEIGHSPTSALAVLKNDHQAEYGKKYIYASADRAICPDLQFCYSHNLFVADALRHRDVGGKAIETLTRLFEIGHSPTSALAVLKDDLQADVETENSPIFRQEYGERKRPEIVAALGRQVEEYNQKCRETCAKLKTSSGSIKEHAATSHQKVPYRQELTHKEELWCQLLTEWMRQSKRRW
ncbi:hypothetical protein AAFF_G00324510 [Aldrovandia affinis]|uniref:Uncharacterized protein n=1 Tax=Aldrovandia affinis TaxID=143900 RepID=A0AAD7R6W5_9TELE|nr:hypothetical protein AAFF_G00324510 [Aldrovandia affinis]